MRNPATWQNAAALSRAARRLDPAGEGIVGAERREQSRSLADAEVFSLDIPFNRTADQQTFLEESGQIQSLSERCAPVVCNDSKKQS